MRPQSRMTNTPAFDEAEALRDIVDSDLFREKLFTNAKVVVAENHAYALRAKQPLDWLINDLASHAWEKREQYATLIRTAQERQSKPLAVNTWAKKRCWARMVDLVRSAENKTAQKLTHTPDVPDRPTHTKQELSSADKIDTESRIATLAYIARRRAAILIPPDHPKSRSPFTRAQLAAILVIAADRNDSHPGVLHRLSASSSLRDELDIQKAPSRWALIRASLCWWGRPYAIACLLNESKKLMGELVKEMES